MKKYILFITILISGFTGALNAQYTNATLNGPWLIFSQNIMYITFDGAGHVSSLGSSDDTIHGVVGTYNVFDGDSFTATDNLAEGTGLISGILTSDSTALFSFNGQPGNFMLKVQNPGALADTLTGTFYDSVTLATQNVEFAVNSSGAITWGSGYPGVSGNAFADSGYCAGYITTTDTTCTLQAIQFGGYYSNNQITAAVKFGIKTDTSCSGNQGYAQFTRTSAVPLAIDNITRNNQFTVYPNPFISHTLISGLQVNLNYMISVTDISGRIIKQMETGVNAGTVDLDLSALAPGMYLVRMNYGQNFQMIKIVKQ